MGFSPGQLLATPGALRAVEEAGDNLASFLLRHLNGDWGDVDRHDWKANDQALVEGTRLLSAYHLSDGTKIWIITEWNRSATTILLPSEY